MHPEPSRMPRHCRSAAPARPLLSLLAFVVAAVLCLGTPLRAADPLTPQEIAEVHQLVTRSEDLARRLDDRVICLNDKDQAFSAQSNELELRRGDLQRARDAADSGLQQARTEVDGYRSRLDNAQRELADAQNEIDRLNAAISRARGALDKCKSSLGPFGFLGFACDIAGELSGLEGKLREWNTRRANVAVQYTTAQVDYRNLESRLAAASDALNQSQAALAAAESDITRTEARISAIKAALETLRRERQDYATEHALFLKSFEEFSALDPETDRNFAIQQLRNEMQVMSQTYTRANALMDAGGVDLPDGQTICAN